MMASTLAKFKDNAAFIYTYSLACVDSFRLLTPCKALKNDYPQKNAHFMLIIHHVLLLKRHLINA